MTSLLKLTTALVLIVSSQTALAHSVLAQTPAKIQTPAKAPAVAPATTPAAATPVAVSPDLPRSPGLPFGVRALPDRIVLSPGADPARAMGVAFRTNTQQVVAEAQITEAVDSPTLERRARLVTGTTAPLNSANGAAHYHQVRFDNLTPDTVYAYRVRGSGGWSEWFQFRTASATPEAFRVLYFGDTQNSILSLGARAIRQGFAEGRIDLAVHAGDLVALRDELNHDDEWGEWTATGGYNFAMIPQAPAPGNHEYVDALSPDGTETRVLGDHWPLQFALPANGAPGAEKTTYFIDYQGTRLIILDGTSALDLGTLDQQTRWLESTLKSSKGHWTLVLFHQPIFTCARPNDTERLKARWKPLFDRYNVDLVLQGHDHCYSRLTDPAGRDAARAAQAAAKPQGPIYMVSVTGSKMYGLNDRAHTQPDKIAEDTSLYQVADVTPQKLTLRTYTASGKLYDGFHLVRSDKGQKSVLSLDEPTLLTRHCTLAADGTRTGPDGGACTARLKD